MARSFSAEATIARPAAEVWAALTDWDNAAAWMAGIDSMKADGETAEGTKLTFTARGKERESEIARCEPGKSVVLRSVQGGVTADYTYEVRPIDGDSTVVTLVADCTTRGFVWGMLSPLLRIAVRMADGKQLEAFKSVVESS